MDISILPDGRLDSKSAAIYMGLAPKTLAMMRCNGTGPKFMKIGRIFYFKSDLDEWISEKGKSTSTQQVRLKQSNLSTNRAEV